MQFPRALVVTLLFLGPLAVWICPARAQGYPDGPGKEIVQQACTACHESSMFTEARRSKEDWKDTVEDMVARGAALMEGERETVIEYLAKSFGPDAAKLVATVSAFLTVGLFRLCSALPIRLFSHQYLRMGISYKPTVN